MNRRMYMFDFARLRSYHKEEFEVLIALLQKLGIEGDYEGIGNCIVGYADMEPTAKPRKENRAYYVE